MKRRAAVLATAALAALVVPTHGVAMGAPAFRLSGSGCVGAVSLFTAPVSRVQPFVPAPFKVYDVAMGTATGSIRVTRCDRVVFDGGAVSPGVFTSLAIGVEPPRGAPGASAHVYEVWRLDQHAEIGRRMREFGLAGDTIGGLEVEQVSPLPFGVVEAVVPWARATHTVSAAAVDPTSGVPSKSDESAWHRGPRGTFRTLSTITEAQHVAASAVTAEGDLRTILGFAALPMPGFVRTFSFAATVHEVPVSS